MENIANTFLFIAGELLCIAGILMAGRLGCAAIGNLTWDSYQSKKWSGPVVHYAGNIGFLAIAGASMATSIAFAIGLPVMLWGGV